MVGWTECGKDKSVIYLKKTDRESDHNDLTLTGARVGELGPKVSEEKLEESK